MFALVDEAHWCEQDGLVVVVFIEAQLCNNVVQALAVVGQVLGVALKGVRVVADTFTKQRLGGQVHLVHRTFKGSTEVFFQRHSDAA